MAGQINSQVAGRRKHKAHKGLRTMQSSPISRAPHSASTKNDAKSSLLSTYRAASKTLSEDINTIHTDRGSQLGFRGVHRGVDVDAPISPPLIDIEIALDTAAKSYMAVISIKHDLVPSKGWNPEYVFKFFLFFFYFLGDIEDLRE